MARSHTDAPGRRYLNLGCGRRFSKAPEWTNIDIRSSHDRVIAHDLADGIPFPDGTFDVVYHSNMLEHLDRAAAEGLLRECCRVLKPGGLCRVGVPDMEDIARIYLDELEQRAAGGPANRHEWMVIEMIDQMVRHEPGGAMAEYIRSHGPADVEYAVERAGNVARQVGARPAPPSRPPAPSLRARIGRALRRWLLSESELRALEVGIYRTAGEPHLWMYDRCTLGALLNACGFVELSIRAYNESAIPGWSSHALDADPDGREHAPDTLYMEARKPESASGPAR
ncbi:MAG: methyltransferase domain-containing protein [Armatimonadetes bacterium]|nr:methyltransferase domain-containing protein [Armatimonadota bacterium]